jgi:hypothetical protein
VPLNFFKLLKRRNVISVAGRADSALRGLIIILARDGVDNVKMGSGGSTLEIIASNSDFFEF